tara:strand:- start:335 stop:538 length:204 start_codon:yes stop_codon:yes gene_type:complete
MVQAYEDAIECECFLAGDDMCTCEEGCGCGCPDCECQEWDETMLGDCACGGNCMCNESEDEENEGGL